MIYWLVPMVGSYLDGFGEYYVIPFTALAFVACVPLIIKSLVRW